MNKRKPFHYSSSPSSASSSSSSSKSDDMTIDTKYRQKENPCIKRLLKEIPTRKSFSSSSSSSFSCGSDKFSDIGDDDDSEVIHYQKKAKRSHVKSHSSSSSFDFGSKITDDYFVIDKIQDKPIPREDGYELTTEDKQYADKQPYGKAYYKDQLDRIRIMNDNNQYTFIKFIAGGMGRSPYDLLDPEDLDRVQQEKEESKQRTQLEMKRRIVTVNKKEKQLKTLKESLSSAKVEKQDLKKQVNNADKEIYNEIDDMLNSAKINVLSDLCDVYDDNNDEENVYNPSYYSYPNILELIHIFKISELSNDNKTSIVNQINEENDLKLTSINDDDVNSMYIFSLYWIYNGHPLSSLIFERLLRDTIKHYEYPNDALSSLYNELDITKKPITQTSCMPLLVNEVFINTLFKDPFKVASQGCILLLGESKSIQVRGFINMTGSDYTKYVIKDDTNLLDELRFMFEDWSIISERDKKREIVIQYFIHKFIQNSKWSTIKDALKETAIDDMNLFINTQLVRVQTVKEKVFNPYILSRGKIIQTLMNGVITISPFVHDKPNLDTFDKQFRRNRFYTKDLQNDRFKRYIANDMGNKRNDSDDVFKGLTPVHQWLDLYLRYYKFLQHDMTKIDRTIAKLEASIDKTTNIIMSISGEEGLGIKDIDGQWNIPEYKQRKSFTSQPSISGIVKLKEEVITFINKTYTLIQQHCPSLSGLPFEEFYSNEAIDIGLCCDFALCIAAEIAKNHVLFPDTYKSQHHNRFVMKSAIDAMNNMKKYSYSSTLMGTKKYTIHVNHNHVKNSLQRRINSNYEPLFQQINTPTTYTGGTRLVMF